MTDARLVTPPHRRVREHGLPYQAALPTPTAAPIRRRSSAEPRRIDEARYASTADHPVTDAPDPDDELFLLGERCAQAYLQADQLHYEAMTLLADFDRRRGWEDTGFGSTAEWLAWRIGIKPGAARERLRTARALEHLPATSRAMKNGEISFTKARAITRIASADTEGVLLELARSASASKLERVVRGWKRLDRKTEVAAEQLRYRSRPSWRSWTKTGWWWFGEGWTRRRAPC